MHRGTIDHLIPNRSMFFHFYDFQEESIKQSIKETANT